MTSTDISPATQEAREAVNAAVALGESDGPQAAIAAYEAIESRFADQARSDARLREVVAQTMFNRGGTLVEAGEVDKGLRVYQQTADTYAGDEDPEVRYRAIAALFNCGNALDDKGRAAEAIATYRRAFELFRNDTYGDIATMVGRSMINAGLLSRTEEGVDAELAIYREVVAWGEGDPDPKKQSVTGTALHYVVLALKRTDRDDEFFAACEELERRYGSDPNESLRLLAAKAMLDRAFRLGMQGRREEEIAGYRAWFDRYRDDDAQGMAELRMTAAMTAPEGGDS